MPRGAWGADRWIDYHYTLDTFNWPLDQLRRPAGQRLRGHVHRAGGSPAGLEQRRRNPRIDPNLKPVRAQEFTLGYDHELTSTMSVGVRYAHKWLDRLIEDVGVQVAGVGEVFMIANPGYGIAEYTLAGHAARRAPRSRRRSAITTAWSSACASASTAAGRSTPAICTAASTGILPVWPARTKTDAPRRTSSARSTACTCRSTRRAGRSTAACRPIGRTPSSCRAPTTSSGARASASRPVRGHGHAAAEHDHGEERAGVRRRPRQPGTLADVLRDEPVDLSRLQAGRLEAAESERDRSSTCSIRTR